MRRAISSSLATALAGCSLFVDVGGISDEPTPDPATDAGSRDASTADAAVDDAGPLRVVRRMTFEQGKLVDEATGADAVIGTMEVESAAPIAGAFSARVRSAPDRGYLRAEIAATSEIVVTVSLRIGQLPSSKLRILRIGDETTPTAELALSPAGTLELEGVESSALDTTRPYRIEIHVRGGPMGLVEAKLAPDADSFGAPFTSVMRAAPDAFDRVLVGQTITSGYGIDMVVDDVEIGAR